MIFPTSQLSSLEKTFREAEEENEDGFQFPWTADEIDPTLLGPVRFTSTSTVRAALQLARLTADDTVCDLGCGDGRVPILAFSEFGVRHALGIELEDSLVATGNETLRKFQIPGERVTIIQGNVVQLSPTLRESVLSCSVIFIYLLFDKLHLIEPFLFEALQRGARIVSVCFFFKKWGRAALSDDMKCALYTKESVGPSLLCSWSSDAKNPPS